MGGTGGSYRIGGCSAGKPWQQNVFEPKLTSPQQRWKPATCRFADMWSGEQKQTVDAKSRMTRCRPTIDSFPDSALTANTPQR
jgi:hypothetical protein